VLAQVWAIVRARWLILLLAAALIFVPVGLLEAIDHELERPLDAPEELDTVLVIEIAVAGFVIAAGALLGDVLYAGVVAAVVIAERTAHQGSLRELLAGLPVARLIAADLLLGLVVVLGLLAFVVPGLVLLTWFAFVAPVIKIEHPPIVAAFRRSRELVRGRFWLVFAIVLPILVASELVTVFVQQGTADLLGEGFGADWAGAALADVLTAPFYALAVVVLYLELSQSSSAQTASR
jgi:hypothetical protein